MYNQTETKSKRFSLPCLHCVFPLFLCVRPGLFVIAVPHKVCNIFLFVFSDSHVDSEAILE